MSPVAKKGALKGDESSPQGNVIITFGRSVPALPDTRASTVQPKIDQLVIISKGFHSACRERGVP